MTGIQRKLGFDASILLRSNVQLRFLLLYVKMEEQRQETHERETQPVRQVFPLRAVQVQNKTEERTKNSRFLQAFTYGEVDLSSLICKFYLFVVFAYQGISSNSSIFLLL